MAQYIFITNNLEEDAMEIPSEDDGTILLSTLQAQYSSAIGLKYKVESRYRAVKLADGRLYAPLDGWQDRVYFCTFDTKAVVGPASVECRDSGSRIKEVYTVKKILRKFVSRESNIEENSWKPEANLTCPDMIRDFEKDQKNKEVKKIEKEKAAEGATKRSISTRASTSKEMSEESSSAPKKKKELNDISANLKLAEEADLFEDDEFNELQREEAAVIIEEYNEEGRGAGGRSCGCEARGRDRRGGGGPMYGRGGFGGRGGGLSQQSQNSSAAMSMSSHLSQFTTNPHHHHHQSNLTATMSGASNTTSLYQTHYGLNSLGRNMNHREENHDHHDCLFEQGGWGEQQQQQQGQGGWGNQGGCPPQRWKNWNEFNDWNQRFFRFQEFQWSQFTQWHEMNSNLWMQWIQGKNKKKSAGYGNQKQGGQSGANTVQSGQAPITGAGSTAVASTGAHNAAALPNRRRLNCCSLHRS